MNTLTRNEFWMLWPYDWQLRIRQYLATTITPDVEARTIAKEKETPGIASDRAFIYFNVGRELFFKLELDYYARKEQDDKWHVHLRIKEATFYDSEEEFKNDGAVNYESLYLKK